MKTYDVIGLGNCLLNVLSEVSEDFLRDRGLEKTRSHIVDHTVLDSLIGEGNNSEMEAEGSVANTLIGISQMGGNSLSFGSVGDDDLGILYIGKMEQHGVKSHIHRLNGRTGIAITYITPDGERTFAFNLGVAASFEQNKIEEDIISQSNFLYISGYELEPPTMKDAALRALDLARHHHVKIAIDLADPGFIERNFPFFELIVKEYADIVFVNENEARAFLQREPEDASIELSRMCKIAVVKMGPHGSIVRYENNVLRFNALPVRVCSTTGAGDIYASGFLLGISRRAPLVNCGLLGTYAASLVLQQQGVRLPERLEMQTNAVLSQGYSGLCSIIESNK